MNRDSSRPKDRTGEAFHGYKVTKKLAEGGMGTVWLAEHPLLKLKAAVKILFPQLSANADLVRRFHNEAVVAAQIPHAGIVKIFNAGYCDDGCAYLLMEYLDGESLRERIESTGPMPARQVADIARQTASVLAAMHAKKITHRDLKPDNVFLACDAELGERTKIIDLGIAKVGDGKTVLQAGTPGYAAPETWEHWENVDSTVDVYALGVITYEMASGQRLFNVASSAEAHARQMCDAAPRLRSIVPDAPFELEAIIAEMLRRNPHDRPSAQHVYDVCSRLAARAAEAPPTVSGHRAAQSTLRPNGGASPAAPPQQPPRAPQRAAHEVPASPPLAPVAADAGADRAERPAPAARIARSVGAPRKKYLKLALSVVLLAVTGAGGWQLQRGALWSREPLAAGSTITAKLEAAQPTSAPPPVMAATPLIPEPEAPPTSAPPPVVTATPPTPEPEAPPTSAPPPVVTATPPTPEPAADPWLGTWWTWIGGNKLTITYEPTTTDGTCGTLRYDYYGGTCYGRLKQCRPFPEDLRASIVVKPECRPFKSLVISPVKGEDGFQVEVSGFASALHINRVLPGP